jgi:DNA-binding transcriptional regulator YhcF (GntR family)
MIQFFPAEMDIQVDFQSEIPLYQQIAQEVRELIDAGKLAPGLTLWPGHIAA